MVNMINMRDHLVLNAITGLVEKERIHKLEFAKMKNIIKKKMKMDMK